MRGKAGPKPSDLKEPETPTAEEIVGKENVVELAFGYTCVECVFRSNLLSEMEEHVSGTGHGGFADNGPAPEPPIQPELFSTIGVVHHSLKIPMADEFLNGKRASLAELYGEALKVKAEKKSADREFNSQLEAIDEQMQEIYRVLQVPFTYENIQAEWRIIDGENARGLYRLDNGELLEKRPLSEEDRVAEIEKAKADNETKEEVPA